MSDANGLPLAVLASAGQAHESPYAVPLLDAVRIGRRRRPAQVAGDRGYSYPHIRRWLRRRHIRAAIPERRDQIEHRRGRPPKFDATAYRGRNVIERAIGWIKEARAIATRYEKLAVHYLGILKLAMIRRHLLAALSNKP